MLAFTSYAQETESSDVEAAAPQENVKGCPLMSRIEAEMPLIPPADQSLVREALNLNGTQRFPVCAFRARSDSNRNKNWIEQYVPSDASGVEESDLDQVGWSLESVESRAPTEKELAKYEHRGGTLYPYLELHELVDFSRLEVSDRSPGKLILVTQPTSAFLADNRAEMLKDHVTTTLVIDVEKQRLDFVTTKLNEEVKPNPFMRVYEFDQSLEYEFVPQVGEVVLTELKMRADVKFVVVRRKFHLAAELYDFSCPLVLQAQTCPDPIAASTD